MVDTPAFQSEVIAYPAITLIARAPGTVTRVAHRPELSPATLSELADLLTAETLPSGPHQVRALEGVAAGDAPWVLDTSDQLALVRRLEAGFPTLEQAGCKVGIGVATGADKAFIGPYAALDVDGFIALVIAVVRANGLADATISRGRARLTLPGYFRPTKLWDLLVIHRGRLVAAVECKSQVGPSFGNNFNNRAEEAIGTAHDFQVAYREGAFGQSARPFTGWLMLVEDAPGSRRPVSDSSPHFPVFPEFQSASYQQRYQLLCQRLVRQGLYSAACALASPSSAVADGQYAELGELTGLRAFVAALAGHVAAEAARG